MSHHEKQGWYTDRKSFITPSLLLKNVVSFVMNALGNMKMCCGLEDVGMGL